MLPNKNHSILKYENLIRGFREVIENRKAGLLIDNLNGHSLASSIETLH